MPAENNPSDEFTSKEKSTIKLRPTDNRQSDRFMESLFKKTQPTDTRHSDRAIMDFTSLMPEPPPTPKDKYQHDKEKFTIKLRPADTRHSLADRLSAMSGPPPTTIELRRADTRHSNRAIMDKIMSLMPEPPPTPKDKYQHDKEKFTIKLRPADTRHSLADSIGLMSGPSPPKNKYQSLKEEYDRNRDELKQTRVILEGYVRELKTKDGELRQSKDTINSLKSDLISVHLNQLEDAKTLSENPSPKDRNQPLKEEYDRNRDELKQTRTMLKYYDRELTMRNGELRQSMNTIDSLQQELVGVHQQLEDAKTLSEKHQVLVAQVDTLSISEVGEKVTALNEEIFQAAATLGEFLIHKSHHEVFQTDFKLDAAAALSQEMVGEKMTNILIAQSQKPEPEVNPLLVQVVLQIIMVNFCVSKLQSWYHHDSTIGGFLSAIYSEIRSNEEQAVSGRWRALTRAYARPTNETWKKELYQKLQSVLKIASWTTLSPEDENSYGQRLSSIFEAINELRMAIGEKVTSADLEIFVIECDTIYNPACMDVAYGDERRYSGKRAPEAIVGTTGIGLRKVIAERSAKDLLIQTLMIPPKVVLMSDLHQALEHIQPTRLKKMKKTLVENTDGANQDGRD